LPLLNVHGAYRIEHTIGGAGGFDEKDVRLRAFAELIERASAIWAGELAKANGTLKAVATWHEQYAGSAIVSSMPPPNTTVSCVSGLNLLTGSPADVPALLAFLKWQPPPGEITFARPNATGLAASTSMTSAISSGLLEIVERDAALLSWRVPGWPMRRLDSDVVPDFVWDFADREHFDISFFDIGEPELASVILTIVKHNPDLGVSVGTCASGYDIETSAVKSFSEALVLHDTIRRFGTMPVADPRSSIDRVVWAYHNGKIITDWYDLQEARSTNKDPAPRRSSLKDLLDSAKRFFGAPLLSVALADITADNTNWHVWRTVAPGAFITPLADSPLQRQLCHWACVPERYNIYPAPFG
jgi:ribosomal protein S12 methylthiotransferase accessory factor YcaO